MAPVLAAVAIWGVTAFAVPAQEQVRTDGGFASQQSGLGGSITIPSGTLVAVRVNETINAETSNSNQTYRLERALTFTPGR